MLCTQAHAYNKDLEEVGDVLQWGIPVTAGLISAYKLDGEGLVQLGEGALWTSLSTHFLKIGINARRPNGHDYSMPSAHASGAAQGAAYLQFRYGWEYGVPAYMLTGLVAYSRVENRYHYWRDVIAGAALATAIQYTVTLGGFSVTNLAVAPYFDGDAIGVYASMNF
ncbi:phosphatase PAP2 family protein [Vibrio viridaestus]|uniref:Phosphatase PAP2 family protein n=1 Tax=Vibrio viridaestus TaxID=2487322 RepID=A0A3N9TJR6_9VIBR|nr:phosphatase PAP2 family protein [Vibrio viridaestus]